MGGGVIYDSMGLVRGFFGGVILGLSSTALLYYTGQMSGMSGILHSSISSLTTAVQWRVSYISGLLLAGIIMATAFPEEVGLPVNIAPWACIVGGFLVGLGARLGSGCTSGHGVCGLARLSPRSLTAVMTFMGAAMLTASLTRAHSIGHNTVYSSSTYANTTEVWSLGDLYVVPLIASLAAVLTVLYGTHVLLTGKAVIDMGNSSSSSTPSSPLHTGSDTEKEQARISSVAQPEDGVVVVGSSVWNDDTKPIPSDTSPLVVKVAPSSGSSSSSIERNESTAISTSTGGESSSSSSSTSSPWYVTMAKNNKAIGTQVMSFLCGLTFGLGLIVSGMTNPNTVLQFLDVGAAQGWNPQLALVMGGAVMTNVVTFAILARRSHFEPIFYPASWPHGKTTSFGATIGYGLKHAANWKIDTRLVIGSVLFGVGWGLTGACPGPAIVDVISIKSRAHFSVTVPAIIVGVGVYELIWGENRLIDSFYAKKKITTGR